MSAFKVHIHTPAKLNIRLKITGRRPDGFHELVTILIPVDLSDFLELHMLDRKRIEISCKGYPVPADETNLVYRAAKSFLDKAKIKKGVSIKLIKNIPVAAGLGGGSSDAAATLLMLNEIHSRPLAMTELHDLSTKIGADVPFFLYCRPSLATGIGDILEPLKAWPEFWYVIIAPPIRVSTSWVYENYRLELTRDEYNFINVLLETDSFAISHILENDLEKVTSVHFPIIDTLKKLLTDAGAEGAIMSGSGPSVFGVFSTQGQAKRAKEYIHSHQVGDVFMAKGWEMIIHR